MLARNALARWPTARLLYRKCEGACPIKQPAHSKGTLIIICGLPGSGKTTHAQAIAKPRAIHLDADEWMRALGIRYLDEASRHQIEALQWKRAKELLALGQTVIFESGPWSRGQRDVLRRQARALGAAVELHCFTAPPDVLLDRVRRRSPEDAEITRELLEEWSSKFRAPNSFEVALYDKAFRGGSVEATLIRRPHPLTAYIATVIDIVLPTARRIKAIFGQRASQDSEGQVRELHAPGADVCHRAELVSGQAETHSDNEPWIHDDEAAREG
jgi:predicted kinase